MLVIFVVWPLNKFKYKAIIYYNHSDTKFTVTSHAVNTSAHMMIQLTQF